MCRWKKPNGEHQFQRLIPLLSSESRRDAEDEESEPEDGARRKTRKPRSKAETDKGALYHRYEKEVHQWLTHLRRVDPDLPTVDMELEVQGRKQTVQVKGCNPFAPTGVPLYYFHGRTPFYNDNFFIWWDNCFAEAFQYVCPWVHVTSRGSLESMLNMKIKR